MRKVKPDSSSDTASQRMRPAITPEARQKQMISLATDCAEDLMRSGKAPSQIIVHYLKLGTKQAELELEKTKKELALTEAKTKSIQSSEQAEELYKNALDAFNIVDRIHKGRAMNMSGMIKTYTELIRLSTFQERFEYLKLDGSVGIETFGFDRYLNQVFYNSKEWKRLRNEIIVRDRGCDLACDGYEIQGNIIIHHMNPITPEDIINRNDDILNPEYLISTVLNTHNAIHYGDSSLLPHAPVERRKNDMCPWRH